MKPYELNPHNDPHTFTIMGRIHCHCDDDIALKHACSVLRDVRTIPARRLFYFAARCLSAHHTNLAEYRDLMGR